MNPFIGWTKPELEEALRAAQEDLAVGKTATGAGAGDTRFESRVEFDALKRIELIYRALYALDPDTYPLSAIQRVTRTRIEVFPDNTC